MNAIAWGAIATIAVFTATQIIQLVTNILRRREDRKNFAKSLKAEIFCIITLGGEARDPEGFRQFIQNNSIEAINAYSFVAIEPLVYKNALQDLSRLDQNVIYKISQFYTLVDRTNAFTKHFKSAEFLAADENVQNKMKQILIETVREMLEIGKELIGKLK